MGARNSVVEHAVERNSWGKSRDELLCCFRNNSEIMEDFTAFLEMHPMKHESSSLMNKFTVEWCMYRSVIET